MFIKNLIRQLLEKREIQKIFKISNSTLDEFSNDTTEDFYDEYTDRPKSTEQKRETYPADCRKKAAVDSNKHDWDGKNRRYWKKKIFVQKHFLSPIYFDGIS